MKSVDDHHIHLCNPRYSRIRIQDGALFSADQYWSETITPYAASTAYQLLATGSDLQQIIIYRNTTGCPAVRIHHPGLPDGEDSGSRYWNHHCVLDQVNGKLYLTDGFDLFIYALL